MPVVSTPPADLWICVADPHRAGQESSYYPGDLNFRMADVIVINKANTAPEGSVEAVKEAAGTPGRRYGPCPCIDLRVHSGPGAASNG